MDKLPEELTEREEMEQIQLNERAEGEPTAAF